MKLLDKLIGSYVVRGTLLSLLVLVGLFTLTEFVEDLGSVGKGSYTMPRAIEYMLLKLPGRIFQLFPEAALIGSLMGLGILASNSELIVVRASGVSIGRICLSVMKAGCGAYARRLAHRRGRRAYLRGACAGEALAGAQRPAGPENRWLAA